MSKFHKNCDIFIRICQ